MQPKGAPIVVVEDDQNLRQMIVDVLESEGYEVRSAGNGKDAMALLRGSSARPALIVLDLMLPKVTGWDLRARLSEDPDLADVPVLAISGIGPELAAVAAEG